MGRKAGRRVLIAAEERLLSDTIATALRAHGYAVHDLESPDADRCTSGLLLTALDTEESIASASAIIGRYAVPWVVVAHSPPGESWSLLLEVGARTVVSSASSMEEIETALDAVQPGRAVGG